MYRNNRTGPPGKGKLIGREGKELVYRAGGINDKRVPVLGEFDLMFRGKTVWLTCVDRHTHHLPSGRCRAKQAGQLPKKSMHGSGAVKSDPIPRTADWSGPA